MSTKSETLQIRVTPSQKAALRRAADGAGVGLSAYVLDRALPAASVRFTELVAALADDRGDRKFALAELNDLLSGLDADRLAEAVAERPAVELAPLMANYVAALVAQATQARDLPPPPWLRQVAPLQTPYFASDLDSLRPHLIRVSPVAFRSRNLFVDSGIGDRV